MSVLIIIAPAVRRIVRLLVVIIRTKHLIVPIVVDLALVQNVVPTVPVLQILVLTTLMVAEELAMVQKPPTSPQLIAVRFAVALLIVVETS